MDKVIAGKAVVSGAARGPALVAHEPLSLWGGLNPNTGEIIDRRHDRSGEIITGRIFVFPQGKGSSSSSANLLESVKAGKAPLAIINRRVDPILALGAILADELYHRPVPYVVVSDEDLGAIADGDQVTILADGTITVSKQ
jgi:uncharacterized protein